VKDYQLEKYQKYTILIFSLAALGYLLYFFSMLRYGFDFSDEGYHILTIQRPREDPALHVLTGFLYHPLYLLLNGNIYLLRAINYAIFLFINVNLCRLFIIKISPNGAKNISKIQLFALSFLLSFASLNQFIIYLSTPYYNILNFMAIAIVATGVLLIHDNDIENNRIIGWIISSVGVYLSFMAKPQTSIILILFVIIWSIISSKFSLKGLISAAIVSFMLLLITSFWIDGSPIAFIERFLEAIKRERLSGQHELFKPFIFSITSILNVLTIRLIFTALIICIYALIIDKIRDKYANRLSFYLIFAAIPGYFIYLIIYPSYKFFSYYGTFLILAPTTGLIVTELLEKKYNSIVNNKHFGFLCILFCMFAVSYGLGSLNDISIMLALSSFFILLGILFLFAKFCPIESFQSRLTIIATFTFIISIAINHMSFAFPYRQRRPIWANNVKINIQEGSGELILPEFTAKYIDDLHKVAKTINLIPDTPMIDLSGRVPGALYILNSYTPKNSWIIGGLNDRTKYVSYIFSTIPCEDITKTWLLIDDDVYGIPFDQAILQESGIVTTTDYKLVAAIKNPKYHTNNTVTYTNHYILKPIKNHDEAISSCLRARNLSSLEE
jgi:hypothetical protein